MHNKNSYKQLVSVIKKYIMESSINFDYLKSQKNEILDYLNQLNYKIKKENYGLDYESNEKLRKLIKKTSSLLIDIYLELKKDYELHSGELSNKIKSCSQLLYYSNLLSYDFNDDEDEIILNDGFISGSVKMVGNKLCYVFGTENNISKKFTGRQGNNFLGIANDCGIAAVTQMLIIAGKNYTENDVVKVAVRNGLCNLNESNMRLNGATSIYHRQQLLKQFKIDSNAIIVDQKKLMLYIQKGHGVIVSVDSGILWNNPADLGENHAILLYGTYHDEKTGALLGFIACDTGTGIMEYPISLIDFEKLYNYTHGANITKEAIRKC